MHMRHVNNFSLVPTKGKKPLIVSEDDLAALINCAPWAPKLFLPEETEAASKNEEVSMEALLTGFDLVSAMELFVHDPNKSDAENEDARNQVRAALKRPAAERSDTANDGIRDCKKTFVLERRRNQQRMFLSFVTCTKMRGHNSSTEKPTMFRDEINTAITFFHQLSKIAMTDKLKIVATDARVNENSKLKTRLKNSVANAFLAVLWRALFGSGLRAEDHKMKLADRIDKCDPELEPHAKIILKIGHLHFNNPKKWIALLVRLASNPSQRCAMIH